VAWPNGIEGGVIRGQPASENYQPPFAYTGTIKKVQIHIVPAAQHSSRKALPKKKKAWISPSL
jgi:hypothetical protein